MQLHEVSDLIYTNLLHQCLQLLYLNKYPQNILVNSAALLEMENISIINLRSVFSLETQKAHISHLSFRGQSIFELWVWRLLGLPVDNLREAAVLTSGTL